MIFKTFDSDSDKFISKIGILNRSFEQWGEAIRARKLEVTELMGAMDKKDAKSQAQSVFDRLGYTKRSVQEKSIDLSLFDNFNASDTLSSLQKLDAQVNSGKRNWQDYFSKLTDGQKWQVEFVQNNDLSKVSLEQVENAQKAARESAIAYNNGLEQMTLGAKAANVAMKALAVAGNMLVMWGISEGIKLISDLVTASDRLKESASELGQSFSSTKSDIESYKEKISDLYKVINDDSSSYEDTYNARQELLKIQDEMIDKFGDEADAVKLVTDAINGQTDSLGTLTQEKWQETVNKFNSDAGKSWAEKVADNWTNAWNGYSDNFDRMVNEMENTEVTFRMTPMYGNDTYEEFSKKLKEDFGADITHSERDDAFTLSGDLDTIYKQLLNIQNLAKGMGIDDTFLKDLGNQADEAKSKLDEYQEMYSQHVLYDKILTSKDYEKSFDEINKAYEKYQEAFASGDEEVAEKAKQNFAEIVQGAIEGLDPDDIDDKSIIDYFNSMYPDLQAVVGSWEFEVKFKAAVDNDKDNFENEVKDAASQFGTVEDIKNYNPKAATDEQKDAYLQLKQYADDYGLTLDQLIDKLTQLGLLQSQSKSDLLNKLIPDHSDLTAGVTAALNDSLAQVDTDVATEWVESLTEEEAKLANSDEFENALEEQKKKLNGAALSADDYEAALQSVKDAQNQVTDKAPNFSETVAQIQSLSEGLDQLDKVYADVYNKGDFDWSSILNNDAFKAAFEGLGDAYNDFIKTISNSPSDLNACQSAFDKLTTAYIYNSDALKNVTEETKQATINMLEQMGVANASEMVEARLAAQKVYTAQTGKNLSDATYAEIASLVAESDAANTTTQYLANLALSKLDINNLKISTNDDVNAIIAIANAAGASAAQLKALKSALNAIGAAQSKFKSDSEKVVTSDKSLTNAYANSKFGGSTLLQKAKNQAQTNKNNQAAVVKDTATSALSDVKKLLTQIQNGAYNLNASNFYAKYGGGSATQSAVDKGSKSGSKSPSGSNSGSGSSKEETPKDYNLIEIAIDRVSRAITNLGKTVSATYKNWSTRNNALAQEMSAVSSEIGIQQQAYNKYMQLANSVGLPENYASLIRNGAIGEITVTDKDLQGKIDKYKEYYEAALDASDAIIDLQDNLSELAKTKFDNINKEYESRISLIKHEADMLNSFIDESETRGHITSTKYYEELMKVERNNIKELNAEYSNLSYALEEALNSGRIQKYSEDWYDMVQTINDTAEAIEDANKSLAEYESTMRKLNWDVFDKQEDYISKIQDESDFIIGLLGKNDLFDKDTGKMNQYGQATAGLHAVNYNAYMTQADDYAKEIQKINEDLAKDPYNTTLIERKQELLELQQKAISSAEDEKQSIKDLISDGYDAMLDALQKMIDKRKELLQAEKDAYDYQNTISEKTKNVADIQKQLIAIQGDDSEEGKANAQKLGASLDEAQKDLQETEYEKYLSDQQQMLDNLYD